MDDEPKSWGFFVLVGLEALVLGLLVMFIEVLMAVLIFVRRCRIGMAGAQVLSLAHSVVGSATKCVGSSRKRRGKSTAKTMGCHPSV